MEHKLEKIKEHFKKHKTTYIVGIGGVAFATITYAIVRGVASQPIGVGIADVASGGIAVAGKKVVMSNVSLISSNRQGSPSWVVRCLETDEVFTSQRKAALAMNLSQAELSQHLNDARDHVNGNTFERICLAA